MIKRKAIRQSLIAKLKQDIPNIRIDSNRTHKPSEYPFINVVSGEDVMEIDGYTSDCEARSYQLDVMIYVASNNHDDDLDDILEKLFSSIKGNRKNVWSFCFIEEITAPLTESGEFSYSSTTARIRFMYEE